MLRFVFYIWVSVNIILIVFKLMLNSVRINNFLIVLRMTSAIFSFLIFLIKCIIKASSVQPQLFNIYTFKLNDARDVHSD